MNWCSIDATHKHEIQNIYSFLTGKELNELIKE